MAIKKVVPLTAPRETLVKSNAEQFSHWCFHPTVVGGVPVELQWVSFCLNIQIQLQDTVLKLEIICYPYFENTSPSIFLYLKPQPNSDSNMLCLFRINIFLLTHSELLADLYLHALHLRATLVHALRRRRQLCVVGSILG